MKKRPPITLISFLAGSLTALPIVYPRLFIVGIVSFALPGYIEYFLSGEKRGFGRAYLRGFSFFMGFGIVIFSWFCALYPLEFTGLGKGAAVAVVCAGWFGLSLLQASFFAFMFLTLRILSWYLKTDSHPLLYSLIFACLYVVFEWMSTKTWAAVPWGRLAVGQTDFLPMIQISSVVGAYGVSFILVFFGCALGVSIAGIKKRECMSALRPAVVAFVLLIANIIFGASRLYLYEIPEGSREVAVAAVQGNVSSHEKWSSESYETTCSDYTVLTMAAAEDGADIVVFPETPIVYNLDGSRSEEVRGFFEELAEKSGCTVITGAFTRSEDGGDENSVVVVTPDEGLLPEKYVKRHLVPFGEYVPMRKLISVIFPPLSDISMLSEDLTAGDDPVLLETEYGKIAPIICFDSIYETLAGDSVRAGGELITLSTNDSWFMDSPAVWEHNRHAVLRSVECGRYLVRSANTGVSSIISPVGEIIEELPPLESGYISADVYMIDKDTVYTKIGNAFIPICVAAAAISSVYCFISKRKSALEE